MSDQTYKLIKEHSRCLEHHAVIGGGKPYEQLFSSITIIAFQELAHALHQHLDPALDVTDPQGAQCTQTVGVRDVLCT